MEQDRRSGKMAAVDLDLLAAAPPGAGGGGRPPRPAFGGGASRGAPRDSYGSGGNNHMRMNIATSRKTLTAALDSMAAAMKNLA